MIQERIINLMVCLTHIMIKFNDFMKLYEMQWYRISDVGGADHDKMEVAVSARIWITL